LAWTSVRVWSSPSRSLSSLAASADVSAIEDLSFSIADSCLEIFYSPFISPCFVFFFQNQAWRLTSCSASKCLRQTSASRTACNAGVSSPTIYFFFFFFKSALIEQWKM
jgi:hypothetical protein